MAEREEQAHRVVGQRYESKSLIEALCVLVHGIHDQGVNGNGLTGNHGPLDRIGKKHASKTASVRRAVDRQPADQGTGWRGNFRENCLGNEEGSIDRALRVKKPRMASDSPVVQTNTRAILRRTSCPAWRAR